MGADGGVAWVRVTGDRRALRAALADIDLWARGSSWGDDSRDAWERQHATAEMLVGPYGTDLVDRPTLDDLPDVVSDLRAELADPVRGLSPDATWGDVVDEHLTAPSWTLRAYPGALDRWVAALARAREYREALSVEGMRVTDWIATVCSAVECAPRCRGGEMVPTVRTVETWT